MAFYKRMLRFTLRYMPNPKWTMMKKELDIARFEPLESAGDVLRGGFSAVYGGPPEGEEKLEPGFTNSISDCSIINNCHASNCTADCGQKRTSAF